MTEDDALADLLAFVLAGRPERVTAATVSQMPPEQKAAVGMVTNVIASLARAGEPEEPSTGLRARILASTSATTARRPRRALLVCDMIVDHLTPGRPLEVPRAAAIVPALASRIEAARSESVPVVYILDRHAPDDPELEEWPSHAVEGSEGAEVWPPLAPKPGDHLVTKGTYSAFHGTELDRVLANLAVDTLVLTGCATEVNLMATATDALQRGFEVEIPGDAQAGISAIGEHVTMAVVGALVPYAPARRSLLERVRGAALQSAE